MKQFWLGLQAWWTSTWRSRAVQRRNSFRPSPILLVVEGTNDIQFLRNISAVLNREDSRVPDLCLWEQQNRCLFLPTGGDAAPWTSHLAALQLPEFHLYDREVGGVTEARAAFVRQLNRRPRCRATLTTKRALENYLHPAAIRAALGIDLVIDDETPVADATAQAILWRNSPQASWDALPHRSRKRRRERAKRLLNTVAVLHMTTIRLRERDPKGEVQGWLHCLEELARST